LENSELKQVKMQSLPVRCKFDNLNVGVFLLHRHRVLPVCFLNDDSSIAA